MLTFPRPGVHAFAFPAGGQQTASKGTGTALGAIEVAKRPRIPANPRGGPAKPVARQPKARIVHTSVYLPTAVHEALREAAFKERRKIHDIVLEGIEMALRKRG